MIGATLSDIRQHVESLASDSGTYYLICGRTGERPVPATGLSFESRPTARAAARATEQYRAALRQYDPQVPTYDVIACETSTRFSVLTGANTRAAEPSFQTSDPPSHQSLEDSRIDFCHTIAGALFETIENSSYTGVGNAIMDTYLKTAESIEEPDELCLRLLASMATELDARLSADEQLEILRATANRLPPEPVDDDPLEATLSQLQSCTLLEEYALESRSIDIGAETRSWDITVTDYALRQPGNRVVTLPFVVELLRRWSGSDLAVSSTHNDARSVQSACQLTLTAAQTGDPTGLMLVSEVSTS